MCIDIDRRSPGKKEGGGEQRGISIVSCSPGDLFGCCLMRDERSAPEVRIGSRDVLTTSRGPQARSVADGDMLGPSWEKPMFEFYSPPEVFQKPTPPLSDHTKGCTIIIIWLTWVSYM